MADTKKPKNSRKALKQKQQNPSTSEANVLAQNLSQPSPAAVPPPLVVVDDTEKENRGSHSQPKKSKSKTKASSKVKQVVESASGLPSYEKELLEMQYMLQKLRLEKEKTEELLKEKDEILKQREEELENKGREQDKLQIELKKLQKLKEFKPNLIIPNLKQKEQDKKKEKKRCPEKKRPNPPYVLWLKDQWNEAKKENPDAEFKDISNMLGEKWKQISAEEKKPYEEKYQAERDAYLQVIAKEKRETEAMRLLEEEQKQKTAMELLDQYLQFKQEAEKDNKKTKKEKDPLKPKQPLSAFFLFSNDRRAALLADNKTILEAAKIAGEEWNNMTDEKKAHYEEIAKKNREKYIEEMELYKQNREEEAENLKKKEDEQMKLQKQEALRLLKKKEKTENIIKKTKEQKKKQKEGKSVDPNKPKKPASSFFLFSKETRKSLAEERPGMDNSTITSLISVRWKELSDEERQVWNSKAAEDMEAYKKELEEYNKSIVASVDQSNRKPSD